MANVPAFFLTKTIYKIRIMLENIIYYNSNLIWRPAAVRSKAVILLSLITLLVCGGSGFSPCFVMQYLVSFLKPT